MYCVYQLETKIKIARCVEEMHHGDREIAAEIDRGDEQARAHKRRYPQ